MKRNALAKAINYALMTQYAEQESLEAVLRRNELPDSSYIPSLKEDITVPEEMVLYPYYSARN